MGLPPYSTESSQLRGRRALTAYEQPKPGSGDQDTARARTAAAGTLEGLGSRLGLDRAGSTQVCLISCGSAPASSLEDVSDLLRISAGVFSRRCLI